MLDSAVKDLHEARKMGLGGAMLGLTSGPDVTYASPEFDPLWAAAQELDMPLAMHNFTQDRSKTVRSRFEVFPSAPSDVQYCLSALIFADVFERFPKLKILSVENDIGWAANYLQRLDHCFIVTACCQQEVQIQGACTASSSATSLPPSWTTGRLRTYDIIGVDK